jgi:hypothetical protein
VYIRTAKLFVRMHPCASQRHYSDLPSGTVWLMRIRILTDRAFIDASVWPSTQARVMQPPRRSHPECECACAGIFPATGSQHCLRGCSKACPLCRLCELLVAWRTAASETVQALTFVCVCMQQYSMCCVPSDGVVKVWFISWRA